MLLFSQDFHITSVRNYMYTQLLAGTRDFAHLMFMNEYSLNLTTI